MKDDQNRIHTLYKLLLTLYPRGFREQLGESMAQTFNDRYNERKRQNKQGLFGFVLWIFVETATGIVRERVLLIKEMKSMKTIIINLNSSAIISFLIVLPFTILELATRSNLPRSRLSIAGFVFMWLFPMTFILILMPVVRNVRAWNNVMAHPVLLVLRSVFLVILAWTWGEFIIDQWPCFLGATGC